MQTPRKTSTKTEMKFYLHTVRSQSQSVTYDTVKDHIVQYVQKTYKNSLDIAESLDKEVMKLKRPLPLPPKRPLLHPSYLHLIKLE